MKFHCSIKPADSIEVSADSEGDIVIEGDTVTLTPASARQLAALLFKLANTAQPQTDKPGASGPEGE